MRMSNPYALWGLILIPIVILMYILKQNYEKKDVASTFLWDLVSKEDEVNTPWQKLKKNLLMVLQIIAIILITLALANPYIYQNKETDSVQIIVMDTTGSMNAIVNKEQTRLDHAKEIAEARIDQLMDETPVTILTIGDEIELVVSNAVNKDSIKKSINRIKPSYGFNKITDHMAFIYSIARSYESYEIIVISDHVIEQDNIQNYLVKSVGSNVSLDYISTYFTEGAYEVLAKVTNRYKTPVNIHLDLFSDQDNLLKGQEIHLEPYETKSVLFENVTSDGDFIYGEIKENDLIIQDNKRYSILNKNQVKKVLLVSEGNIFIEKAILASGRYELYKTNKVDVIDEKYDLYIFDALLPSVLPETGQFIFMNLPEVEGFYKTGEEEKSGLVSFIEDSVTKHVKNEKFIVSSYYPIIGNDNMKTLATVGEDNIIVTGNREGKKYSILSFDVHNSDFPLNISFPVLVDRLLLNLLGDTSQLTNHYYAGESIAFEPLSTTEKAWVIDPSNDKKILDIDYPITYYDGTKNLGVYQLIQENNEGKQKVDYITIEYHTELESTIDEEIVIENENVKQNRVRKRQTKKDFMSLLIIVAIVVALYEWKKYVIG